MGAGYYGPIGGGSGSGVPAGSAVITDAFGPIKISTNDTNNTPTDTATFALTATYAETNATQSETASVQINGLAETNATPTEGSTLQVLYTTTSTWTAPT